MKRRHPRDRAPSRRTVPATLLLLLAVLLPLAAAPGATASARAADGDPAVTLSKKEAGKGGEITVKGTGWRPEALLMLLICGRSSPERGVIGGTNSCANADGRAVTTDKQGAFSRKLPVAEPPEPCPCVVHVATVTGEQALVDAVFTVAGHPTAELPPRPTRGGSRSWPLPTWRATAPCSPGSGPRPYGSWWSPSAIRGPRP